MGRGRGTWDVGLAQLSRVEERPVKRTAANVLRLASGTVLLGAVRARTGLLRHAAAVGIVEAMSRPGSGRARKRCGSPMPLRAQVGRTTTTERP